VIAGGGIAGASIAYHLAELGWREVVVLEQDQLVGGNTSHAPGLVGQLRTSPSLVKMLVYSVSLYRRLSLDGAPGYLGEGSLRVASSKALWDQVRELVDRARPLGLNVQLLGAKEAGERFPLMDLDGVEGAAYLPDDGSATAPVLAGALIRGAKAAGVEFHAGTPVTGVDVRVGRVRAVETPAGRAATDTLVVAAGIWSPLVARLAGVSLPLTPLQHQYAVTDPLPALRGRTMPNLRDPDRLFYLRQNGDGLVVGGYERPARPWDVEAIPNGPNPTGRAFDPGQFEPVRRGAAGRVPALASAGWARRVNGLESFTPDGEFLLGPAAKVTGLWVACGFCAHGVSGAGGVGRALAGWIAHGDPGLDLSAMDPNRLRGRPLDPEAVRRATCEVYNTYYDIKT
jgi:4-methylaminobutanoate oxidase (formaldehyde-forming)